MRANDRQVGGDPGVTLFTSVEGSLTGCVTGVYKITNRINGRIYVGGAYKSFVSRFRGHRWALAKDVHGNWGLQADYDKYGPSAFQYSILQYAWPPDVEVAEQKWIDTLNACDPTVGYNICKVAGSALGVKRREETKVRMKAAAKLAQNRPEVKAKIAEARKGKPTSDETKSKLSAAAKAQMLRPGMRELLSSKNIGKTHTEESKAKISASLKGVPKSKEHARKVGESLKGRTASPETIAKLKAKTFSEETRRRMSEAAKRRCKTPEGKQNLIKAARASNAGR